MKIDELIENFELLDDWEDKYRYLIDLGAALPPVSARTANRRMESQRLPVSGLAGSGSGLRKRTQGVEFQRQQRRRHRQRDCCGCLEHFCT